MAARRRGKPWTEWHTWPTLEVLPAILGKVLVHEVRGRRVSGVITEAEAYIGEDDPACHAAPGLTKRNAPLYGPAGLAYVYLNYGLHYLVNAVTEPEGSPAAILIRALKPLEGLDLMRRRRVGAPDARLTSGPGNLTEALGIDLRHNRTDLATGPVRLEDHGFTIGPVEYSRRIGIRVGTEKLWRACAALVVAFTFAACTGAPLAPQQATGSDSPSSPAAPAPPTGPQPDFIFTTGMNVVAEGGRTELSTTAFTRLNNANAYVLGLQQSALVSSGTVLQTTNPTVAMVTGTAVVGRAPGTTAIRASYHGRAYDLPMVVVRPNAGAEAFAGTWRGIAVRHCADIVGSTKSCYPDPTTGQPEQRAINAALSLTYTAGLLTGTVELGGSGGFTLKIGQAFGGLDPAGRLVIGGLFDDPSHGRQDQLRDWRFDLSGNQLTGTGTAESAFLNVYGPVLHRVTYTSITLTRQ